MNSHMRIWCLSAAPVGMYANPTPGEPFGVSYEAGVGRFRLRLVEPYVRIQ